VVAELVDGPAQLVEVEGCLRVDPGAAGGEVDVGALDGLLLLQGALHAAEQDPQVMPSTVRSTTSGGVGDVDTLAPLREAGSCGVSSVPTVGRRPLDCVP
jgi:hypothetical protein